MNKTKQAKKRTYTVQEIAGRPSLTLRGDFLRDYGLDFGNQVQLLEGKNMLVLLKVPAAATAHNNTLRQLAVLEEQAEYLRSTL